MLKNSRQLIIGIVIGVILASTVAFGADIISNSYFNDNLKLAINGNEVQDIRIITVEIEGEPYGRNYYSIADLIKAFNDYGGISAKVDFDAKTQTTVIEVEREVVMITPTPEPKSSPVLEELKEKIEQEKLQEEQEPEGGNDVVEPEIKRYTENGIEILEVDGEKYIGQFAIVEKHKHVTLSFNSRAGILKLSDASIPGTLNLTPKTMGYLEEEIPWYDPFEKEIPYIKYDYYINILLPKIEELIK